MCQLRDGHQERIPAEAGTPTWPAPPWPATGNALLVYRLQAAAPVTDPLRGAPNVPDKQGDVGPPLCLP
jgi:hypothetical protein